MREKAILVDVSKNTVTAIYFGKQFMNTINR